MRGRGHKIGVANRAGMHPRRDQPGNVRDVRQQPSAGFAGDFSHPFEIDDARISARADGDHFRLMFARHLGELIVINPLIFFAHAVVYDFIKFAGKIGFVAVSQMAAVAQIHRQHFVARFEKREINGHVRLAAGVRLDVGMFGPKKFFGAIDGELLDDVHVFTAAIPSLFRITFGVFIREHRALGLHHRRAGKIFTGDQLDVFLLAQLFEENGVRDFRINGL